MVGGPKNVSLIAARMASYAASDAAVDGFCVYALRECERECGAECGSDSKQQTQQIEWRRRRRAKGKQKATKRAKVKID